VTFPHLTTTTAHQWRGTSQRDGACVKGNSVIRLVTPDHACGVEFDAVVVVEPSAFPRNLGRFGPLYTSLTRANRELNVVHAQPLPDGLRRR